MQQNPVYREKLIIRHVFMCLSKHIIIYIFSTINFVEKMIPEFQKVWNHVQIYIHCSIAKLTSYGVHVILCLLVKTDVTTYPFSNITAIAAKTQITGGTTLFPKVGHINPCLVLVQNRKTRPVITEKIVDRDVKNQTNQTNKLRSVTFREGQQCFLS